MSEFSNASNFLLFFTKKLRLSNPWNYKVPFLICIPYFLFLLSRDNGHEAFQSILASVCIIIGVAGFGYLTNDLGDRKKDLIIGKENVSAKLTIPVIVFLFMLFLSFAILPWFYLPMDIWSSILLLLQFFLFSVYAFYPFRLKEKGFVGVITDALYAHVNPAILAGYTFYMFTNKTFSGFIFFTVLLSVWQLMLGCRNIIFHHLKDFENDVQSETKTFATYYGKQKTIALLTKFLLPLEVISFLSFAVYVNFYFVYFLPFILIYWVIIFIRNKNKIEVSDFRANAYLYLDDLYIKWIPIVILAGLLAISRLYLPVFVLHLIIFKNDIKVFALKLFNR